MIKQLSISSKVQSSRLGGVKVSVVMETAEPPSETSDSDLYITEEIKTTASAPNQNYTDDYELFIPEGTVYISIISCLEIPIICLAIYAVYSLIKSKQAAPVFVINLLISDLIQIVCTVLMIAPSKSVCYFSFIGIIWSGVTGVYFMTCIVVERCIMIAHPLWHRSHRSVTCLVCTSLTGWLISLIIFPIIFMGMVLILFVSFIPYVVIIVCFAGSCRSLSRSVSLTPLKKQIVLFFVVISYTLLILPVNILCVVALKFDSSLGSLVDFTFNLYVLNPLVDCLLYVFMRSDAENIIGTPLCCSRLKRDRTETGQTTSTDLQLDHV